MFTTVQQQMSRYPIFSYKEVTTIDQFQTFKDEALINSRINIFNPQLYQKKRNNKITNIYNKIITKNIKDPLYPKGQHPSFIQSKQMKYSKSGKVSKERSVNKFVGQLMTSIQSHKQQDNTEESQKSYRQKINLLKRIIEHYNFKNLGKDNYTNLIKTFGLKIEQANLEHIAIKKNIHPRQNILRINAKSYNQSKRISRNSKNNSRVNQYLKTIEPKSAILHQSSFTNQEKLKSIDSQYIQNAQNYKINDSKYSTFHSNNKQSSTPRKLFSFQSKKKEISSKLRRSVQRTEKVIIKPFKRNDSLDNLQNKISKYRQFLFILNISNNFYKQLDIVKYEQNFKYFLGKGNNVGVIRALMQRRFWFQQTKDVKEADFIWTQLKIQEVYQRQKSQINQEQQKLYQRQKQIQDSKISEKQQQFKITQIYELNDNKQQFQSTLRQTILNRRSLKKIDPNDPVSRITTNKDNREYFSTIELIPSYKKKQPFQERIKYLKKNIKFVKENSIIHNHLYFNGFLGNKKAMFYCLQQYCRVTEKNLFDIVPLTFHIKKGYFDEQFKAFMNVYLQRKKSKKLNVWIMKPGEFSNRGQGISCSSKIQQIKKRVSKCKKNSQMNKPSTLIIQSYITNPLLYNYRKFDVRVYMLITSHNKKLKGYWYQQGYIRTSSFPWNLQDFDDTFIHLTNDAIQKNCYQYGRFEQANKLSFSQFQRYLDGLPTNGRNMDFLGSIFPQMKQIACHTIKATFPYLDPKKLENNFEIFGLDFMIDDRMKPWLIQVNTNPCLQINCTVLSRIIPYMLQNALRISLDPIFPPPNNYSSTYKYNIPQNALHYNKFELIFDEQRDGPPLMKLFNVSNFLQSMDDVEQDKQQFEQQECLEQNGYQQL